MGWLLIPTTDFKVTGLLSSQSHVMYHHVYHNTQYNFSTGQISLKCMTFTEKKKIFINKGARNSIMDVDPLCHRDNIELFWKSVCLA